MDGVQVYTAPITRADAKDNIILIRVTGSQEWAALGNQSRDDEYTIEASVLCIRKGAGESKATEARDRAGEVLDELEAVLREMNREEMQELAVAIGANQLRRLNLARINLEQGASDQGRWAQVDFDIEVSARI